MKLDTELLKCSLILGILFFVFSHPYLYRVLHRQLYKVMSFVDDRLCPTEGGVLVHAIIFGLVVYFGKQLYQKYYPNDNKKPSLSNVSPQQQMAHLQNQQNNIPKKCRVYCEKLSNKIQNKMDVLNQNMPPMMNNNQALMNNQPPMMNNQPPMMNNQPPMMNNQPQMMNNQAPMMNNQPQMMNNNQAPMMNNNQAPMMNNNQGPMMNNNQAPMNNNDMGGVNLPALNNNIEMNNAPNNFDDMMVNTLSGESNNQNNLGCGSMPGFTNQLSSGNMFSENTTYVDDMYSSVNF